MKFLQIITLLVIIVCVVDAKKFSKKHHSKQAQFGRNYRKPHANPSMNPLPREYETGPISNFAPITPKKYAAYNRYVSNQNRYLDSTGANAQKGLGQQVSYRLHGKKK